MIDESEEFVLSTGRSLVGRIETVQFPELEFPSSHLHKSLDKTIFDKWSEEDIKKTLATEPLIASIYRRLSTLAGLVQPLDEADYKAGIKEYHGHEDDFHAFYTMNKQEKVNSGFMLHSTQLPFDAHLLFTEASLWFLLLLALLYFLTFSSLTSLAGWGANCFDDISVRNAIPQGFLLLSGVGDQVLREENTDICLWINSIAILTGVYISLPVFGAVVLVRLLENRADLIKSSNQILLTKRKGTPVVMLRCVCGNGRMLTNFKAHLEMFIIDHDKESGENYAAATPLEVTFSRRLSYSPTAIRHVCDESSPLIREGVVVVDEYGVPKWDLSRIGVTFLECSADGTRSHSKTFVKHTKVMIEPDEKGRLPIFESAVISNIYQWYKFKGQTRMVGDITKLPSWKYSAIELRPTPKNEDGKDEVI